VAAETLGNLHEVLTPDQRAATIDVLQSLLGDSARRRSGCWPWHAAVAGDEESAEGDAAGGAEAGGAVRR